MRYLIATALLTGEALLQVSLFSRITVWGATPQFLLLTVIAWSLVRGPGEGMFWGFVGGLLYDAMSHSPIGVCALAAVLVAAVSGLVGRGMFNSNPLLPVIVVWACTYVYFLAQGFLLATLHFPVDWQGAMGVALPAATANSVLALVVCPAFAYVSGKTE